MKSPRCFAPLVSGLLTSFLLGLFAYIGDRLIAPLLTNACFGVGDTTKHSPTFLELSAKNSILYVILHSVSVSCFIILPALAGHVSRAKRDDTTCRRLMWSVLFRLLFEFLVVVTWIACAWSWFTFIRVPFECDDDGYPTPHAGDGCISETFVFGFMLPSLLLVSGCSVLLFVCIEEFTVLQFPYRFFHIKCTSLVQRVRPVTLLLESEAKEEEAQPSYDQKVSLLQQQDKNLIEIEITPM